MGIIVFRFAVLSLSIALILAMLPVVSFAEEVHHAAPVGSYGGIMNPDVSAVVNTNLLFSDNRDNELKDKVMMKEAELAFQSYLYPGVYGNFIYSIHMHDNEWKAHPEEAYVSFLDLPLGFQLTVGRKLIGIGKLNAIHTHHWSFASSPLVIENFFGHPWFDDGLTLDWLVPNPWDIYFKVAAGVQNGTVPHHEEEADTTTGCAMRNMVWHGKAYTLRANLDIPFGALSNAVIGYSAAMDEGYLGCQTTLQAVDLTVTYRRPVSYKKVKWQSEVFFSSVKDNNQYSPYGLYSMLKLTLSKYWELGVRYDMSEFFHNLKGECDLDCRYGRLKEYGGSAFMSYYFTHSMYLRGEYRYLVNREDKKENQFIMQLVWGLGPHAHRLED